MSSRRRWRAARGWLERALERGGGLVRHGPRLSTGGLVQQGWRDTKTRSRRTAAASSTPTGKCPSRRSPTPIPRRWRSPRSALPARLSGDSRWDSLADRTVDLIARAFTPDTMAVGGGDTGRRRRLATGLAAVGRRVAGVRALRLRRAPMRAGRADRVRAPHAVRRASTVRSRGVPPRRRLAVRLMDRLGRAASRRPPDRRRARAPRRAGGAATVGDAPELYAVTARGPRADPDRQPRAGLDDRSARRARAKLGRARRLARSALDRGGQPLTAPAVSPATIRFWKITTSTISGTVIITVAALIVPIGIWNCVLPVKNAIAADTGRRERIARQRDRQQELVPREDERQQPGRHQPGRGERQHDLAEGLEVGGPVDQRGLLELLRDLPEERRQDVDRQRQDEGQERQDQAEVGVVEADVGPQLEQRRRDRDRWERRDRQHDREDQELASGTRRRASA